MSNEQEFADVLNKLETYEFDKCNDSIIQWAKANYSQDANVKRLCAIFNSYAGDINENIRK